MLPHGTPLVFEAITRERMKIAWPPDEFEFMSAVLLDAAKIQR
jgi:hypothetical protein